MFASPQVPSFSTGALGLGSSFNTSSSAATPSQRNPNQSFGLSSSFAIASPPSANTNTSFGGGMSMNTPAAPLPVAGSSGSPVFQSPSGNKFPAGGGPVIFTPQSAAPTKSTVGIVAPTSPYHLYPGSASSFLQSPLGPVGYPGQSQGHGPVVYAQSPYSSTMIGGGGGMGIAAHHLPGAIPVSPIAHGYGITSPVQVANSNVVQPFGGMGSYGARAMGGSYSFHQGSPTYYPREDVVVEPMHCSPVGQAPIGSPPQQSQFHPLHRNMNSPPRPQYLPAYLTGVDAVAAVQTRPRRVFDRSPSTSPPILGGGGSGMGGKSPSKAQTWGHHHEGHGQQTTGHGHGGDQGEGGMAPGGYNRRNLGQGPTRQLRFADMSHMQSTMEAGEEKEKPKKSGPPIHGFGFGSSEVSTFLSSLTSKENNAVPGAAITQEAIKKAGMKSPVAESNWITVFGFPAAAASFIYTHFAQFGSILQSKCNPGGNWLHIQYASIIQARRALACNGKVLGGTIMVGVITSPKEVIQMFDKSSSTDSNSNTNSSGGQHESGHGSVKSPLQEKNLPADSSSTTPATSSSTSRGIRPLVSSQITSPVGGDKGKQSAFVSPSSSSNFSSPKVSTQSENIPLPTPSSGILNKAMEYMFGW